MGCYTKIEQLGDESSSFRTLRDEVDALLKPETANIVKLNEKIRSRGQAVPLDRQDAESSESWLDVLVCSEFRVVLTKSRPPALGRYPMAAYSWTVSQILCPLLTGRPREGSPRQGGPRGG